MMYRIRNSEGIYAVKGNKSPARYKFPKKGKGHVWTCRGSFVNSLMMFVYSEYSIQTKKHERNYSHLYELFKGCVVIEMGDDGYSVTTPFNDWWWSYLEEKGRV